MVAGAQFFIYLVITDLIIYCYFTVNKNYFDYKGLIGVVWFILLMILTSDSPSTHKFISDKEKTYILEATSEQASSSSKYVNFKVFIKRKTENELI